MRGESEGEELRNDENDVPENTKKRRSIGKKWLFTC